MITDGRVLLLAGEETLLAQLPPGRWIGGTAAQFLTPQGSVPARGLLLFTDITSLALHTEQRHLDAASLHRIARHYPQNGFAVLIVPGFSALLLRLTSEILDYQGVYDMPLTGWVSAVDLAEIGQRTPKTFAGTPHARDDCAAVMYVTLPETAFAQLRIVNLFTPGSGPEIRVPAHGFHISGDCLIDGEPQNLARYMETQNIDPSLPLIADQEGAMLNVSILRNDAQSGTVSVFAPVSPALTYRFAETILDYQEEFVRAASDLGPAEEMVFSSLGVLNLQYAALAERHGLSLSAPVSFGEIAYTVLNQTLTCLSINQFGGMEEFNE